MAYWLHLLPYTPAAGAAATGVVAPVAGDGTFIKFGTVGPSGRDKHIAFTSGSCHRWCEAYGHRQSGGAESRLSDPGGSETLAWHRPHLSSVVLTT